MDRNKLENLLKSAPKFPTEFAGDRYVRTNTVIDASFPNENTFDTRIYLDKMSGYATCDLFVGDNEVIILVSEQLVNFFPILRDFIKDALEDGEDHHVAPGVVTDAFAFYDMLNIQSYLIMKGTFGDRYITWLGSIMQMAEFFMNSIPDDYFEIPEGFRNMMWDRLLINAVSNYIGLIMKRNPRNLDNVLHMLQTPDPEKQESAGTKRSRRTDQE